LVRNIANQTYFCAQIYQEEKTMLKQKEELIEKLGVHIECKEQIAPLAARILATLILTGKKGISFESLVGELGASKSTIFTHLTMLQASQRITYFTKSGDRKKYFILTPDAMIKSMTEMIDRWNNERQIHQEVMEYKKEINKSITEDSDSKFELEFHKDYITFLEQASASVEKLKKKLTDKN